MGLSAQLRRDLDELIALETRAAATPLFTAASLCGGHAKQLKAVTDTSRFIILLCSRRAGKTVAILYRFLLRCQARPSNCVYIALTKDQARTVAWDPAVGIGWKRLLHSLYGDVAHSWHNETRMVTTFPNGSKVKFTGCSDVRTIETELGSGIDEVVVDESQSSPASVLHPLTTRILPNSLTDRRGTMLLAGTIPDTDGGVFMDIWQRSKWSRHNWSQMENPHMPHAAAELAEYLEQNPGLTIDSPVIQRERFGRFVYDKNATAYMYDRALNGYKPELYDWAGAAMADGIRLPPNEEYPDGRIFIPSGLMLAAKPLEWVEWMAFALDPAADSDRVSIQGIGWGTKSHKIQHLFDWTSDPAMRHTTSEMFAVAGLANRMYGGLRGRGVYPWKFDAGSAKNTIDNLQRDFGIPLILAARKGSLKDGVDRTNTLLREAKLMLMEGSSWEEDAMKARRDPGAWIRGQFKWAATWHPDASEAGRYSLEHYHDSYREPPKPPPTHPYEIFQAKEAAKAAAGTGRRGFKSGKTSGHRRAFE